jgi:DNA invertase Pin-like site-specific DNA recombinase
MKAIIYARFSPRPRESAERTETIESQIKRCEEYCRYREYEVAATYEDREKSGGDRKREGLNHALEHVKRLGQGAVLVVYSLSRLSRATADSLGIMAELRAKGVQLASTVEVIDTTTPIGRLVYSILSATNEYTREEGNRLTSERMQDAQQNGRVMTRRDRLPYGREVDPDSPKHPVSGLPTGARRCDAECDNIDWMFELRDKGLNVSAIKQRLDGYDVTNRGKAWRLAAIRKILNRGPE